MVSSSTMSDPTSSLRTAAHASDQDAAFRVDGEPGELDHELVTEAGEHAPLLVPLPTVKAGRYALVRRLGQGSQAETFLAVDKGQGAEVAVKRFDVREAKTWKDVELAEREAVVLRSLSHPNLPGYRDHFEEEGRLYLVTEYVPGVDLGEFLRSGGRLSHSELLELTGTLAEILSYLGSRIPVVVHRDIKPRNIIRTPEGRFVLVDFGSVRDGLRAEGGSTVAGTFGYMAPEQFQGRALPATDVYGVGVTLLSLLTGSSPERFQHRGLEIDLEATLGPGAHPAWARFLAPLLNPNPERRAEDIRPFWAQLTAELGATPPGHPRPAPTPPAVMTVGTGATVPPWIWLPLWVIRLAMLLVFEVALPVLFNLLAVFGGRALRETQERISLTSFRARAKLARLPEAWSNSRGRAGWTPPDRAQPRSPNPHAQPRSPNPHARPRERRRSGH
jgi:hypothetical protein